VNEDGERIIDAVNKRLYTPAGVRVYIGWTVHRLIGHDDHRGWYAGCGEAFGPAGGLRETYDALTCIVCAAGGRYR
jgi:hypothetical protein